MNSVNVHLNASSSKSPTRKRTRRSVMMQRTRSVPRELTLLQQAQQQQAAANEQKPKNKKNESRALFFFLLSASACATARTQ